MPNDFTGEGKEPQRLDFLRRFIYDVWNDQLVEVERQTTAPLMTPLMMVREHIPRFLSAIAKNNADDTAMNPYENKMPTPDIAAAMIAGSQPRQATNAVPFKTAAIGRVNGMTIFLRAGQPGELVSDRVEMVP